MNAKATTFWEQRLIDAGDGTGDAILELPDELIASLGWEEGDELSITQENKYVILMKIA